MVDSAPSVRPASSGRREPVNRLWHELVTRTGAPATIAATMSRAGDSLEQEADRVTDEALRGSEAAGPVVSQVRAGVARQGTGSTRESPGLDDLAGHLGEGRPLDAATRALSESRLGHHFGDVRIHVDEPAAEGLQALAFTIGRHVVFAPGRFDPATAAGRRLLFHELVHTLQQRGDAGTGTPPASVPHIQRQEPPGAVDTAPSGSPYSAILPGYSQAGDTCGAASLVTALLIWDREHWNPAEPNSRVVTACNLILAELARSRDDAIKRWTSRPSPEVSKRCGGDRGCIEQAYTDLSTNFVAELQRIRAAGRAPGATISEGDYQRLGFALYFLWREGGAGAGLSSVEIERIQDGLGLKTMTSGNVQGFDDIFRDASLVGLQPDQFAQVFWFVRTGRQHAFLVGRLGTGEWFLSDQGPVPAAQFRASSLAALREAVRRAADSGSYWLFTGTMADYMHRFHVLPGWTGIKLLGPQAGTETKAEALVAPGTELGEVDAGPLTIGDTITSGAFLARRYSLSEAQAQLPAASGGGLIVEMPAGVFSLYATSAVTKANLGQTSLDAADSAGMLLARPTFVHAWLIPGTASGARGAWFQVY